MELNHFCMTIKERDNGMARAGDHPDGGDGAVAVICIKNTSLLCPAD